MRVHVIGPVVRRVSPLFQERSVRQVYFELDNRLSRNGFKVILPISDRDLESAEPERFLEEIERMIEDSEIIVTVLSKRRHLGPPVEATIAAFMGREQYVLSETPSSAPRLLLGLPNVKGPFGFRQIDEVVHNIGLSSNSGLGAI